MYAGKLLVYPRWGVYEEHMTSIPAVAFALLTARVWVFIPDTDDVAIKLEPVQGSADTVDLVLENAYCVRTVRLPSPEDELSGCKWERITQISTREMLDQHVSLAE